MKWVLFVMIMAAGGEPTSQVDPMDANFQSNDVNTCSEQLLVEREKVLTYREYRYLVCDWVSIDEIPAAQAFHEKQFRDAFAPF